MKEILRDKSLLLIAILFLAIGTGCNFKKQGTGKVAVSSLYTCPMHPDIIRHEPGKCPICGMELVLLKTPTQASESEMQNDLKNLLKPVDELVLSEAKTIRPQSGIRREDVLFNGVINYNTLNFSSISSRVTGRIEKLYVKYTYQEVRRGQKLMEIYSPDLAGAQQELLFLHRTSQTQLADLARQKLHLLGMTDAQIGALLKKGKVSYRTAIYSPYSGYIAENSAPQSPGASGASASVIAVSSSSGMGGMESPSAPSGRPMPPVASGSPLLLREGQYVNQGQPMFRVFNNSEVWAEFYASPAELKGIRIGEKIAVQANDVATLKVSARIHRILPAYVEGSNFALIRSVLTDSSHRWRVGQLITVKVPGKAVSGRWIPRSSLLQLGDRYVVFVKEKSGFRPRYIKVVHQAGEWFDVGSGLRTSDAIALNAWFLVDSESFVKVQNERGR